MQERSSAPTGREPTGGAKYLHRHGHGAAGSDGAQARLLHQLALSVLVGDAGRHSHTTAPRARRPLGSLDHTLVRASQFLPG